MTTTQHITPGTILAVQQRDKSFLTRNWPKVSHALYTVSRVTATQAIAAGSSGEIRVRVKDMKVIGMDYTSATVADKRIQAEHAAQMNELARFKAAHRQTEDLVNRQLLHQLKLSTDQLEALAKAWTEIKEMAPANQ